MLYKSGVKALFDKNTESLILGKVMFSKDLAKFLNRSQIARRLFMLFRGFLALNVLQSLPEKYYLISTAYFKFLTNSITKKTENVYW